MSPAIEHADAEEGEVFKKKEELYRAFRAGWPSMREELLAKAQRSSDTLHIEISDGGHLLVFS